jgi:hypothetical protein
VKKVLLGLVLATLINPAAAKTDMPLFLIQEYCFIGTLDNGAAHYVDSKNCHEDSPGMMKITGNKVYIADGGGYGMTFTQLWIAFSIRGSM